MCIRDSAYTAWIPAGAPETVTVTTANPSNPRIDRLVMYVDRGATPSSATANNPTLCKLMLVAGTPAGSPSRPSNGTVDTAVSNNPYIDLADIRVNAGVTQITDANITDTRVLVGAPIADGSVTAPKVSGLDKSNLTVDSNPYKFSVYRNAAANSGNGAFAKVSFDTELYDTNSNFASGSYTAPVSGFYQFNWSIRFGAADKDIASGIVVNGSSVRIPEARGNASTAVGVGASSLIQLTAGDVVEVHAYATTTQALAPGLNNCWFDGFLVSRT